MRFQHLKQWKPTSIVSALSLESVRIASRNKVHKTPKGGAAFKTSFLLTKPKGYPLSSRATFLNGRISVMCQKGHPVK